MIIKDLYLEELPTWSVPFMLTFFFHMPLSKFEFLSSKVPSFYSTQREIWRHYQAQHLVQRAQIPGGHHVDGDVTEKLEVIVHMPMARFDQTIKFTKRTLSHPFTIYHLPSRMVRKFLQNEYPNILRRISSTTFLFIWFGSLLLSLYFTKSSKAHKFPSNENSGYLIQHQKGTFFRRLGTLYYYIIPS